jgi:lipopolysaccharide transport system ATP-binding protein
MPEAVPVQDERAAATVTAPTVAIRLVDVDKTYKLYPGPRERFLDALGLYRCLPKWFRPAFTDFPALRGLNLTVRKSERIGIIGRNGAGKTTLLKLITGNFAPSAGSVQVKGTVQALMQVGLGFHPELTGYDNIRAALVYNGLANGDLESALADIIDFAELGEFLHQPLKTYSLGMRSRTQFAAATAVTPDILIIDEILGAGDSYFSAKSAIRMRKLAESGCTLLLVSHSMPQILQFCEKAIWIDRGAIVMSGQAQEVVGAYEVDSQRRIVSCKEGENAEFPDYRAKRWISDAIERQEIPTGEAGEEISSELDDGRRVFRWPSERGVKIRRISCSANGREAHVYHSGHRMEINLELEHEVTARLQCRYYLSIFNLEALRVAWMTSPVDTFDGRAGNRRLVTIGLDPLLLGSGDFVLSCSVFDGTDPAMINMATRYDLLARCLQFRVVENDGRQSPIFHHPASWKFHPSLNIREP